VSDVHLAEVASIVAPLVDPRLPEYRTLPLINGENIESGTGRLTYERSAEDESAISPKYLFEVGDVLYSKLRPYLRKVVVAEKVGLCSADMYPLQAERGQVDPGWLKWRLLSPQFTAYAVRESARARMPKLNRAQLLAYRLLLPPLDEQRRTAARLHDQLHEVDALVASATAEDEEFARLRTRVYEAAFPVTPLSVSTASASPDGWMWRSLGSLGRLESGHTPSRSRRDWWGGDIPWIALPDIRALDGRTTFETLEHTNPDGIAHSAARVLPAGTVVLSRTASVGFVTIMGRPMATSQDFVNWVCGPDLDPEFLMHLFIRSRERFRSLSAGAVHQTVYFPTAMALRVCVPSIDAQRRIAARLREQLAEIDRAKAALDTQRKAIDALPAALLREVFGPPGHVAGSSKP
jgi:type I restriction enzyme S subunit